MSASRQWSIQELTVSLLGLSRHSHYSNTQPRMPSFFQRITSRTGRGSGPVNITQRLNPSIAATPSAIQNDSQSPPTASNLPSSGNGVSAAVVSPLEPHWHNPPPKAPRESPSPVPPIPRPQPDHPQIADAPGQQSPVPSPSHSTSSLVPSNAPSETKSFQSADLLESHHAPAAQSVSSLASSDISSHSEPSNRFTPSRADFVAVRSILFRHFPEELVQIILDAAQYYPHSVFAMPARHLNHPLAARDGRLQAILTSPIVDSEFISRVVIRTESHDQGWSSYPQDQGTFNNSWTWLDLALIRNPSESAPADAPPDWRIYTNLHASRTWQTKEVVLDTSNEIIRALRPGDSLAIWAEARYPGWVNIVRSARIEVVYQL
ncbi:hypothetical protein EI94DRAFT_1717574 [Lactarius quietus]|nr:hypothetical protein EI94DRAFT_1717574 [Lactarius quietus]